MEIRRRLFFSEYSYINELKITLTDGTVLFMNVLDPEELSEIAHSNGIALTNQTVFNWFMQWIDPNTFVSFSVLTFFAVIVIMCF